MRYTAVGLTLVAAALALPAAAQGDNNDQPPAIKAKQEARFPQPVRVGTLTGWPVFLPGGRYERVGTAAGVFKPAADDAMLVVRYRDHLVALPLDGVALVGAMIKAVDTDRDALDKLPPFKPAGGAFLVATDTVRIGLEKKY